MDCLISQIEALLYWIDGARGSTFTGTVAYGEEMHEVAIVTK